MGELINITYPSHKVLKRHLYSGVNSVRKEGVFC